MNKLERRLKEESKFKKRLKNHKIDINNIDDSVNVNCFRTTGSPCSCYACQGDKFKRKEKHKSNKFNFKNFNDEEFY